MLLQQSSADSLSSLATGCLATPLDHVTSSFFPSQTTSVPPQFTLLFLARTAPNSESQLCVKGRVLELILVLGSQPAGDVSHKPGGRLPLLSARPAVTPATLKRAATNFAA